MPTWTTLELKILKEEYATADLNDLADRLGRTVGAIKAAASHANLKRKKHKKRAAIKHHIPPKNILIEQKEILEDLLSERPNDTFLTYKLNEIKKELGE